MSISLLDLDGKPNSGESKVISSDEEEIHKQDKEEEPKKKRGLFGRFKKWKLKQKIY